MVGVTQEGTSRRVFAGAGYLSGGKTGTAQAVSHRDRTKNTTPPSMEEHQRDHALYIAFAPADDPKIALAVIVENAGFGCELAAPIARRVFDYWLLGQYPNDEDLAAVSKGEASAPIGNRGWPPRFPGRAARRLPCRRRRRFSTRLSVRPRVNPALMRPAGTGFSA